jgi:hypothetical protein
MEIGELESDDLGEIITKSRVLEKRFKKYCRQHSKIFTSTMFLGPDKIILKCYLTDEDSRTISNS